MGDPMADIKNGAETFAAIRGALQGLKLGKRLLQLGDSATQPIVDYLGLLTDKHDGLVEASVEVTKLFHLSLVATRDSLVTVKDELANLHAECEQLRARVEELEGVGHA